MEEITVKITLDKDEIDKLFDGKTDTEEVTNKLHELITEQNDCTDEYKKQRKVMEDIGIVDVIMFKEFMDFAMPFIPKEYYIHNEVSYNYRKYKNIIDECVTNKLCPHCRGNLYLSDLPDYPYVCPVCDENFFGIEVREEE